MYVSNRVFFEELQFPSDIAKLSAAHTVLPSFSLNQESLKLQCRPGHPSIDFKSYFWQSIGIFKMFLFIASLTGVCGEWVITMPSRYTVPFLKDLEQLTLLARILN